MIKGRNDAAWVRGFFLSILLLLLNACSDKENIATSEEVINVSKSSTKDPSLPTTPPFNQLILEKISIDYPYTADPSFTAFIRKLRARIDNKNMRAMFGELSPHFICQSSACQKGLPIAQQFEGIVLGLSETPWKNLLTIIDTKHYQQVNGHICGPASANFIGEGRENIVGNDWGYINAKNLRLRKQPSTRAKIITHLTYDAVRLLSTKKVKKQGLQWLEVETLTGQRGFVADKFFLMLNPPQICYQQVVGEWKISGFRSP